MAIDNSRIISDVKILLAKGIDGVGIESIEKTGTSGLVDTYTITYTDSRKTTFTITNGNGIASVKKTSTSGLVDTYTITFDDGSTETFDITNGRGITKIEKTATVGNVDTYTITYNDGTTSTYEVTNGAGSTASGIIFTNNGEGATNVQDAVDNTLELIAPIQLTLTADKTYNAGDQFVYEGLLYEVTATIASGTAIIIGSNAQLADTVAEQLTAINSNLPQITSGTATLISTDDTPWVRYGNVAHVSIYKASSVSAGDYSATLPFTFANRVNGVLMWANSIKGYFSANPNTSTLNITVSSTGNISGSFVAIVN